MYIQLFIKFPRLKFGLRLFKRPSTADLLSLTSFFDRQGIPELLLKPFRYSLDMIYTNKLDGRKGSKFDGSDNNNETDSEFEKDVAILRDYCLITLNKDGDVFEMHRFVQLSIRKWLEACGLQDKFKQK